MSRGRLPPGLGGPGRVKEFCPQRNGKPLTNFGQRMNMTGLRFTKKRSSSHRTPEPGPFWCPLLVLPSRGPHCSSPLSPTEGTAHLPDCQTDHTLSFSLSDKIELHTKVLTFTICNVRVSGIKYIHLLFPELSHQPKLKLCTRFLF